jgi:hypothetical protein
LNVPAQQQCQPEQQSITTENLVTQTIGCVVLYTIYFPNVQKIGYADPYTAMNSTQHQITQAVNSGTFGTLLKTAASQSGLNTLATCTVGNVSFIIVSETTMYLPKPIAVPTASPAPTVHTTKTHHNIRKLTGGGIAGVVIGSFFAGVFTCCMAYYFFFTRRARYGVRSQRTYFNTKSSAVVLPRTDDIVLY